MSFLRSLFGRDPDYLPAVESSIPIFLKHQNADEEEILNDLINEGITEETALLIIEFVPLAFGRVFLANLGAKLEDRYIRYVFENGKTIEKASGKLTAEPVYKQAAKLARSKYEPGGNLSEEFVAVSRRSAEVKAIMELVGKGSKPEDVVLTPPYLQWRVESRSKL